MTRHDNKTILITGATDGIGLALARRLDAAGYRLVLVGRKARAELTGALFRDHLYCQADLSQGDAAVRVAAALREGGITRLNALVHNAGAGYYGPVESQSPASIAELVTTNLIAPISLTHALLPLLEEGRGTVCFVSSVVSTLPGPDFAVYTATKAALEAFARNLRLEMGRYVAVKVVRPGATRTGFHRKMKVDPAEMNWRRFPPPDAVAAAIAKSLFSRRRTKNVGLGNGLVWRAGRCLPRLIDRVLRAPRVSTEAIAAPAPGEPPRCLITGAADGIGRALAFRYAEAGYAIVGIDIDAARGAEMAAAIRAQGGTAAFIQADLGNREGIDALLDLDTHRQGYDVVIHNAGINAVGHFKRIGAGHQARVIAINLLAPMLLTRGLLAAGCVRPGATFVFVGSLSTYLGYPGAAAYAASKDGLSRYARGLANASGFRYRVLRVYPGPVRTAHASRYSPDNRHAGKRLAPERLAELIFRAHGLRLRVLVPGLANSLLAMAGHCFPRPLEYMMQRVIFQKLGNQPHLPPESGPEADET